jgi:hypothetical protein
MKTTIYIGFKQEQLIKYNLSLDEALILRTLKDMYSSKKMKKDNKNRLWCKQDYLLKEIPIVGSMRTLQRKLDSLVKKNFIVCDIVHFFNNKKGNFFMVDLLSNIDKLDDYDDYEDDQLDDKLSSGYMTTCHEGTRQVVTKVDDKLSSGYMTTCRNKDLTTTDLTTSNLTTSNLTTTTEKENEEKKNVVVVNSLVDEIFINTFIKDFDNKYNCTIDYNHLVQLYKTKGKDLIIKYFDHFQKIINSYINSGKTINSLGALFKSCVLNEYTIPKSKDGVDTNKPIQATNYEQREYSDEFFDGLYANLEYIK